MRVCLWFLCRFSFAWLLLVATLTLTDKALTPIPQERLTHPQDRRLFAENESLHVETMRLRSENAQLATDAAVLKLRCEYLMRHAVLPPGVDVPHADLIPPQNVPTAPRDFDPRRD